MKVLAVSEQAIVVCNVYMIHDMKPPDVSSFLKPKKSNLAHIGLKSSKRSKGMKFWRGK